MKNKTNMNKVVIHKMWIMDVTYYKSA